jgi:Na+:H+ antiporter, NhaA family
MSNHPNKSSEVSISRLSPLRDFLHTESSGAVLLATAALAALIWANSPWSASYESLWTTRASIGFAGHSLDLDLRHWVNDGLMTIFFFVVGLEIKREATHGHLSSRRAALLPVIAAIGGMALPALFYLAIAGSTAPRGWAIPVATDIALAVGVLTVAKGRVPSSLRAFLLGLAIVDDIGGIIIIAVVYSSGLAFGWMAASFLGVALAILVRRSGVQAIAVYVVVGVFVWFAFHEGGIHPTIAGVMMGLLAPASPRVQKELVDVEDGFEVSDIHAARIATHAARNSVSIVEWLQHVLHPWSSFFIVPVFALANSGIEVSINGLRDAFASSVMWGIFFGLLVGKPLGIFLATRLAIKSGVADAPEGAGSLQIVGVGTAAGIGFTVALFITELALTNEVDQTNAKMAILLASVTAAVLAIVILLKAKSKSS